MCCRAAALASDAVQHTDAPRLYDVLGIDIKATAEEIRVSYIKLARRWHPDRHGGADTAKRIFQQIQCAYEVLSNERRRAHYDLQWLQLLDVEDYLDRFKDLILTANGLGLALRSFECFDNFDGFDAFTSGQEQGSSGSGPVSEDCDESECEWGAAAAAGAQAIKAA